jgi:hypothetical protein
MDMIGRRLQWKQRVALAVAFAVATPALATSPALGAEDGTVHATVTVGAPCITLPTTSVEFGTLTFSTPDTWSFKETPPMSVINCSGIPVDLLVRGTDATSATSAATWNLYGDGSGSCSQGPNAYGVGHVHGDYGYDHLTNLDQAAATGVPSGGRHSYRLTLLMPCTGSDGAGETMSFQAIFTATF